MPNLNDGPRGVAADAGPYRSRFAPAKSWQTVFLVAIVVLLGLGAVAGWQFWQFSLVSARVERAYDVVDTLDRIMSRLVDAETGVRGYALTEDAAFLEAYNRAGREVEAPQSQLTQLLAASPGQRSLALTLGDASRARLEQLALLVEAVRRGDMGEARRIVSAGEGQRRMDEVRAVALALRASATSTRDALVAQAEASRRSALTFMAASLLMAALLGFLASSVRRQFEHRRGQLEQELTARLEAERETLEQTAALQRSETFNRSILDHTADSIQVLSADGGVVLFNQPGLALNEIEAAAARTLRWPDFWGSDSALAAKALSDAAAGGNARFSAFRPTDAGVPKWWDVNVTAEQDAGGRTQRFVSIARDMTAQRHSEEERGHLLASERSARSDAERSARLKDEFVSTLSHELRSPLNAIIGWVAVLKRDRTPETLVKAIDVIDRNSRRQSQMVDDLLDVSRIVSGKMRLDVQPVDVASAIDEALASAQPAAEAKGVRLLRVLGSAAMIQGDSGRLQQVIWNLLSNAIKFTPRGGMVQVTLQKVHSHVHVQVSDTGQGIHGDMLPHVFERFKQGTGPGARDGGGLGLGLAIVKNLVEMHGGTVDAYSAGPGKGAVFTVRLPLSLAGTHPTALNADAEPSEAFLSSILAGITVLVLDDEPDARELVQRLLEDAGAAVTTAGSPAEALSALDHGCQPQVIVSDIGMPEEDGYQFISHVRHRSGALATVPAAALTALARVEDRKRALMAGFQAHLAKPVDPTELVAMVASLAGRTGRPRS
ncbi:MAG: ATP-binding protein [Acidobacteriota bacterium]